MLNGGIKVNENILKSQRLVLRPIKMDDTNKIVKWRNNQNVKKNFIFRDEITKEIHQNWMHTKVQSGVVVQFIIERKIDEIQRRPIGTVYYRNIDKKNNSAEYGIFIGEDEFRGQGYGTEATKMFIQYGFEKLKFNRIFLRLLADNYVAMKIYLNVGFKKEGIARKMVLIDNVYTDIIFMSMLIEEFNR